MLITSSELERRDFILAANSPSRRPVSMRDGVKRATALCIRQKRCIRFALPQLRVVGYSTASHSYIDKHAGQRLPTFTAVGPAHREHVRIVTSPLTTSRQVLNFLTGEQQRL
jgi:hypothetical protein